MELYKSIENFPNYEVSNYGNVRNIKTQKLLKHQKSNHNGVVYNNITLFNESSPKGTTKTIHRLVGEAFIPNPDNKPCIDHIDRNSTNNNVSNLRWATYSENNLNRRVQTNNSSGYKNISICNDVKPYRVAVKNKFIGVYKTLEEAVKARDDYTTGKITAPTRTSLSGEKYIVYYKDNDSYRVELQINGVKYRKRTKTLEEAIKARDDYLNSL